MAKIILSELAEYLRSRESVSEPMLMDAFGLGYDDAKQLMHDIVERGWASDEICGVERRTDRMHLGARRLKKREFAKICEKLNTVCRHVISFLSERYSGEIAEIAREMYSPRGLDKAITYLEENGVIYCFGRRYFLNIDTCSAASLIKFDDRMRYMDMTEKYGDADEADELKKAVFAQTVDEICREDSIADDTEMRPKRRRRT